MVLGILGFFFGNLHDLEGLLNFRVPCHGQVSWLDCTPERNLNLLEMMRHTEGYQISEAGPLTRSKPKR